MFSKDRLEKWTPTLRWVARIWSVAAIVLILGFIVGEGLNPSGWREWLGLLMFPFGISAGMILAWRHERLGGSITIGCLLCFYLFYRLTAGVYPRGLAWFLFSAPGFLFLLSSKAGIRK